MSSIPLSKIHLRTIRSPIPSTSCRKFGTCFVSPTQQLLRHPLLFISLLPPQCRSINHSLLVGCSISAPMPPTSKEEAVLQAKISLSSTLEKPLNNPKLAGKRKKLKQPRLRVEIPVIDDSPSSLIQLALDVFGSMPIRKKGSLIKILALWSDLNLAKAGTKAFGSRSDNFVVQSCDVASILNENTRVLSSADVVVFLAPAASKLKVMKTISEAVYPKPVVIFNPMWNFDEESEFGELRAFVDSFEVVYSFMGLEVRGILSQRKGVIFKCVRDGILSGEKWNVFVEENNDLKLVSSFKVRPSIFEVETVLYNLMAINSPITKSAKFLKDLVSKATSKK